MKKLKVLLALLIAVFIFSACANVNQQTESEVSSTSSESEILTSENESVNSESKTEDEIASSSSENEGESKDESNSVSESKAESTTESITESGVVKGVGESIDGSFEITREDGSVETIGDPGLKYTVNSFEIFDSVYDSGIEFNMCLYDYNFDTGEYYISEDQKNFFDNNKFILVDMTATYNAPEGGADEIVVRATNDIIAVYKNYKMPDGWLDEFIALREDNIIVVDTQLHYLSTAPMLENGVLPNANYYYTNNLKDGESLNFQVGIFCWEKFIEYENVYLQINGYKPGLVEGYDGFYFSLFPEE